MMRERLPLLEVDSVRITTILDNSVDLLMSNTEIASRFVLGAHPFEHALPVAEHGFSAQVTIEDGPVRCSILFDTGLSPTNLLTNLDTLEIRVNDFQAIVLSHGHPDHAMGLTGLMQRMGSRHVPLVLHPDSYLERKVILPDGQEHALPAPKKSDLEHEHIQVIEEVMPSFLLENRLLISGEIPRTVPFETGFPTHHAYRSATWKPDPFIMDDQCVIAHVRGKGLVVLTGCGHAGIINVLHQARILTGIECIYAVIGGFHLTGPLFEAQIASTLAALQEIGPRYVVPCHCTGWKATYHIAQTMPQSFIAPSVGTTYTFS